MDGKLVNPCCVILPVFNSIDANPSWCKYYQLVEWDLRFDVPKSLLLLELEEHGTFVYRRCPPFKLESEECGSWLQWGIVNRPGFKFGIKMLQVKQGEDPNDSKNGTKILSAINYFLYSHQITHHSFPSLTKHPTTPTLSKTIDRNDLSSATNILRSFQNLHELSDEKMANMTASNSQVVHSLTDPEDNNITDDSNMAALQNILDSPADLYCSMCCSCYLSGN